METKEQIENIVNKEIHHNLCLTAEKEINDNPDLLMEAKNYFPQDENGKQNDDGEYPEIMEYWAVSEWLGDKLESKGEVIFEMLDFIVWGRQATGQAITMDNVFEEIANDIKID